MNSLPNGFSSLPIQLSLFCIREPNKIIGQTIIFLSFEFLNFLLIIFDSILKFLLFICLKICLNLRENLLNLSLI